VDLVLHHGQKSMFRDVERNRFVLRDNGLFLLSTKKMLLLGMLTRYLTRLTTVPLNSEFRFGMKLSAVLCAECSVLFNMMCIRTELARVVIEGNRILMTLSRWYTLPTPG
jgi:hydrogenase-4 membrane subunit HyfE